MSLQRRNAKREDKSILKPTWGRNALRGTVASVQISSSKTDRSRFSLIGLGNWTPWKSKRKKRRIVFPKVVAGDKEKEWLSSTDVYSAGLASWARVYWVSTHTVRTSIYRPKVAALVVPKTAPNRQEGQWQSSWVGSRYIWENGGKYSDGSSPILRYIPCQQT